MEKEELKQRCLDAIDANRDLIIQLGDDVYKTPELGYKEFKTTERMIKAFQEIGEEPETETGAYRRLRLLVTPNGLVLLFRSPYRGMAVLAVLTVLTGAGWYRYRRITKHTEG